MKIKDTVLAVLRHGLTAGGTFLAAYLHLHGSTIETVGAALLAVIGAIWGAVDEYLAANK